MFRVQIISLFLETNDIGKCKANNSPFCAVSHIAAATNSRVIASVHWKSRTVYVGAAGTVLHTAPVLPSGSAGVDGLFSALPATRPAEASLVHGGLMRLPDPEHPGEAVKTTLFQAAIIQPEAVELKPYIIRDPELQK